MDIIKATRLALLLLALSLLAVSVGCSFPVIRTYPDRHRSSSYQSHRHCCPIPDYELRHRRTMRELERRHWRHLPDTYKREIIRERLENRRGHRDCGKRHYDSRKPSRRDNDRGGYRNPGRSGSRHDSHRQPHSHNHGRRYR